MAITPSKRLAHLEAIEPQLIADLIALRKFAEAQIIAFGSLWGPSLPSSRVREQLLREISIDFCFHRSRTHEEYQKSLGRLFEYDEVSRALRELESVELIYLAEAGALAPSQRVMDWFSLVVPQLMEEAGQLLQSR